MRDIFNDPEFDKFLYGGIHDLDEPIGSLVYNLYKAGIQTTWSCSGHTGRFLVDGTGGPNAAAGNQVYQPGLLFYKNTPQADILTRKLEEITKLHSFAFLERKEGCDFYLEMRDLVIPICNPQSAEEKALFSWPYSKKQIPAEKANKRYEEFLKIWAELTNWSETPLK